MRDRFHLDKWNETSPPTSLAKETICELKSSPHGEIHPVTASIVIVDGKLSLTYQSPVGSFKQDCELLREVLDLLRDMYGIKQIMCIGATDMKPILPRDHIEIQKKPEKVIDI